MRRETMRHETMRQTVRFLAFCFLAGMGALFAGERAMGAELKVGDEAPPMKLGGSDGKTYSLADFNGKSVVVVAWFPKAFTGG